MEDNKLFILHYINMQEELSLDDKERMWSFLKEATEEQVIYYLTHGNCVNEIKALQYVMEFEDILNEGAVETIAVKAMLNTFKSVFTEPNVTSVWKLAFMPGRQGFIIGARGGIGAGVIAALIATAAYKAYQYYYGKYEKQCKGKKGATRQICIANAKVQAKRQQYSKMQKASVACSKTKDPEKCKSKLQKKMTKVKSEIDKAQKEAK